MRIYLIVAYLCTWILPSAAQTISPSGPHTLCGGQTITLTATGGDSYQWKLNNTDIGGATSQSYTAANAGTYTVVITTNGVAATSGGVVVATPGSPNPSITFPGGTLCASSVAFTGSASGGTAPYKYAWSFSGGGSSASQNPVHDFAGNYGCATTSQTATLTVTDANGCSGTQTRTVTMQQSPDIALVDVNFPFSPFNNCNNNPTSANPDFTITAKINSSSNCVTTYTIDWGDGSPVVTALANGDQRTHTYSSIGAFNLVLTGTGTNGCVGKRTYVVANQSNPDIGIGTTGPTIGCADLPVNIQINLWQGNSAGTTYLLEYGDGNTLSMTHPINNTNTSESINYTYKSSSCETQGTPDYTLAITATNACRSKRFSGGNITVYTKPKPNFSVGPVCAQQQVCFVNETISGYYDNCSTNASYSWNFGDGSPASTSSCHTYTTPGNYSVTLTVTNGCGVSNITKQICVSPAATSAFTVSNNSVCAGSTVTTTNTSALGSCVSAGFSWDVTYAAGFCGSSPDWAFASGSASSATPSFTFNGPGTYTVRLRITGACGNDISEQTINVKSKPSATLDPIGNVCGQPSITPTATFANCGLDPLSFSWKIDGTEMSTIASPGALTISAGNHTIELTATNECGSDVKSQTFSNNTGATLTAPASTVVCGDASTGPFNFTTTPSAPVTWTNDHPEIGLPASGSGNIAAFAPTNNSGATIVATVTATATLNNCPDIKTFTITVHPRPGTPIITTPVNYCHNDPPSPLSATAVPGHQLRWYTTSSGGTGSTTTPTPATTITGTTTYYVDQINTTTGCASNRTAIVVNVSYLPAISGGTPTNPVNCATATGYIDLNGLLPSTTLDFRYVKNGGAPVTVSLTSDAAGVVRIPGLSAGTYSAIVAINNGCTSNSVGPYTLVDPNPPPPPTPGAAVAICQDLTISLTASSAEAPVTWNWTGPGSFSSTQQNPAIANATPAQSGVYSVNIIKNNCPSAAANVTVTVYPRPAAPTVNATTTACLKSDLQLNANTSFAGPVTWAWSGPNGFTSAQQNPLLPNATASVAGNYQVSVTSTTGSCTSPPGNTNVIIRPIPVITSVSYINAIGCSSATGSIILNGLLPSTAYAINFSRDGAAQPAVNATSAPDGTLILGGLRPGTYTNLTATFNGCTSDQYGPYVLEGTAPFSVIATANGELCQGSTLILNARATDPGIATYSWTGPNGFTSNIKNPAIPNAGPANAGVYEATITINGCPGKGSVTAVISAPTTGGNTDADASVCPGQNNGIITLSNYNGRILRWESSVNNGQSWEIVTNTTSTLNYTNLTASTSYRALVQSGVCASQYSDLTAITVLQGVRLATMQPTLIQTCDHDTAVSFTATAINDAAGPLQYYWYINGDLRGSANPFIYNFRVPRDAPNAQEFSIVATAENNLGCNDRSEAGKVVVNALPVPEIQISPSAIQREPKYSFTFTDASPHGNNDIYTWNMGDTSRVKTGREVTHDYKRVGSFEVDVYVEDKVTGCHARDTVQVTIIAVPGSLVIPNAFYPGSNVPELRTFKIKGTGMTKFHLQVFDAWGKVVFETKELNADGSPREAWNGNYMNTGRPMPQDAYTWKIVAVEFENGKPWPGMSHNGGAPRNFGNLTLFR